MSLKAFHVLFISVSTILSFGVAGWAFRQYQALGETGHLLFGVGGVVSGLALLVYGHFFLKKLKNISYL
jgi:hypothetical protein